MSLYSTERDGPVRPPDPASQYLLERLQERRSRNAPPKRSRHTDFGPKRGLDDDIFLDEAVRSRNTRTFDSSPLAASTKASDAAAQSGGPRRRAPPGVRDMDAQLDQLSKQNFALKLELDHRREQTRKMQERIDLMQEQFERAELLQAEHAELLKINKDLVDELDKRAKAVEEAVEHICELEERVAELEDRNINTRPSTAHADSGYAGTETHELALTSSPPTQSTPKTPLINLRQPSQPASAASAKLQGILDEPSAAKARREPLFMSQKKPSTNALRSVYLDAAHQLQPVKSFQSLLSRQDSRADDEQSLNSPRLSLLSESSFPSIYSPKKQKSPDRYAWEGPDDDDVAPAPPSTGRAHLRQDSIKRVSQWISERDMAESTPSKSAQLSAPLQENVAQPSPVAAKGAQQAHYQSLNDALSAAAAESHHAPRSDKRSAGHRNRAVQDLVAQSNGRPNSFGGPMFGEPLLPPTPDSASTRMLRASRSSIVDERSLLDTTPAAVKGYDALEPDVRTAPRQMRSSIELNSAYSQNVQHRGAGYHPRGDESSSDEDDDNDRRLDPIGHFGFEYGGYPDGKSLLSGTPSRFITRTQPPRIDWAHDGYGSSVETTRSPVDRRRPSAGVSQGPPKPRLTRVETSPTVFGSITRMISPGGKSSAETVISPRSAHSGSSGNRTVVQNEEHYLDHNSPDTMHSGARLGRTSPPRSRASPSPARTLSQKTQSLFRRFSHSNGTERNEKSPILPTLTSTPSSAYVNNIPIEIRRPRTSHSPDRTPKASAVATAAAAAAARPPSTSRDSRRPSVHARTRTEPPVSTTRPTSTAPPPDMVEKEKKPLFKRHNSVRTTAETGPDPRPTTMNPRADPPKRRGSIKDAVTSTARRPWRPP